MTVERLEGKPAGRQVVFPGAAWRSAAVTYVVTVLCIAVYLWEKINWPSADAALIEPLLDLPHSGWWAILMAVLVHEPGWPWHILFNLVMFVALGQVVERTLGWWRYAILLVALAWVSSSYQIGVERVIGIGLSGVVYGVFGFMLGASPRDGLFRWYVRRHFRALVGWAVICVVLTQFKVLGVANTAHFSGLIFGAVCGLIYGVPRFARGWALLATAGVALGGVLVTRANG